MDLNQVSAFLAVAEAGSFSRAAPGSGFSKSTLSRQVAKLEDRLGLVLIQRSTRAFELTSAGRQYYLECKRLLTELESVERQALELQIEPQGRVRFTAPAEVGANLLAPLFLEFSRMYPKIELDLVFTDRVVSMIEEKFDLAMRTWGAAEPNLKARKLGPERFVITCAPSFLKQNPAIRHPKELSKFPVVLFSGRRDPLIWKWTNGKERCAVRLDGRLQVNNLSVCKKMTQEGLGLSFLPYFYAVDEIQSGSLIHLLPVWHTEPTQFALVYPDQKYLPAKVRVLIDFLSERLRQRLRGKMNPKEAANA